MEISVIRLTAAHIPSVATLEELCFSEPWSEKALALLLSDGALGAVATDGHGTVIAYGGMLLAPDGGQITSLAVHPKARRQGAGRAVLASLIREARERGLEQISLEVRVSNETAIALYESEGFFRAGVRKRFYRKPVEDGLVMLLPLKKEGAEADT